MKKGSEQNNIQEYVAREALKYAYWRDQQLKELEELRQFKKDNSCAECNATFVTKNESFDYCTFCKYPVHENCFWYTDAIDTYEGMCEPCLNQKVPKTCTGCDYIFHRTQDLDVQDTFIFKYGGQCSQCLRFYCYDCKDDDGGPLCETVRWGIICVECWDKVEFGD